MARKKGANVESVNPMYALIHKHNNNPVVENDMVLVYPSRQIARNCKTETEKVVKVRLVLS